MGKRHFSSIGHNSILVIHGVLKPGGATRVAIDDAVGLKGQGWQVGFAAEPGEWSEEVAHSGVRLHRLFFLHSGRYPAWFRMLVGLPLNTLLLIFIILHDHYHCLYLHHRQLGIACELVARILGVKYIFLAHVDFRGWRVATRLGKNILAVSKNVKDHLVSQFCIEPAYIQVLPNAVKTRITTLDSFAESELRRLWRIHPAAPIVACVALLNEQKAHHVLLDAWVNVAHRFPNAVLLIAGDGPLRSELEAQAERLGIAQNVRFLGMVEDVYKIYTLARFVVLSSNWEGMPLTLLEAAANGIPAVATRVSGVPEVVLHEQTGLLVEPGNPVALGEAINLLLENESMCRRLGANAARLSQTQFSHDQRLNRLVSYLEIVKASKT